MDSDTKLAAFVLAQEPVYDRILRELAAGRKESHWMWFIFPQLAGLGRSAMAQRFALTSAEEAFRYFTHPVLGPRLRECVHLLLALRTNDIETVLDHPDELKLRSSLTLFATVVPDEPLFQRVLNKYYGGNPDSLTLDLLRQHN